MHEGQATPAKSVDADGAVFHLSRTAREMPSLDAVQDLQPPGLMADRPQVLSEPKPPFPKQKLPKPGLERDLNPRPKYEARNYKAAGKLAGKKALITGGDSGIGRAVADATFCRELVDQTVAELGGLDVLVSNAGHQNRKERPEDVDAERGIRVNCVAPGPVWTPLNVADEGRSADQVAQFGAKTPLKRPAQPEELAPAYVFFASDADSSFITGEILAVMGGATTPG
jgi:enoyl-ACP reductase-like protein